MTKESEPKHAFSENAPKNPSTNLHDNSHDANYV